MQGLDINLNIIGGTFFGGNFGTHTVWRMSAIVPAPGMCADTRGFPCRALLLSVARLRKLQRSL